MTDEFAPLEALARKATPGSWHHFDDWVSIQEADADDSEYIRALRPELVLAMVAALRAADAMRDATVGPNDDGYFEGLTNARLAYDASFDALTAALTKGKV